jgi:Short C-terminal domain
LATGRWWPRTIVEGEPIGRPAAPADPVAQLKELAALKEQGHLTDEEFAAQKARILGA